MNRLQIHCGLVVTGISAALMTAEATSAAARTLRDEAFPDTEEKAAYRFITEKLDEVRASLQDAERRLQDLQLSARRAN